MTRTSRRSFLATTLAAAAAAVAAPAPFAHARTPARTPASATEELWRGLALEDAAGRTFQLRDGRAPVTVVAMWANWCHGCVQEAPRLAALQAARGADAEILLLSHPEYWDADQALARRMRLPLRLVTPSASNGHAAIAAALLAPGGGYEVPRSLVFHAQDESVAFNRLGWPGLAATAALRPRATQG